MITRVLQHVPKLRYAKSHISKNLRFSSTNIAQDGQPQVKTTTSNSGPEIINLVDRQYSPGKEYEDFKCIRAESIPEFGIVSYTFKHNKSGTELWYLNRNDPNNVFSVNFRTTPFDSTGLPHILEHSVLCGSQKYPVRDPFFKMLNRSVATFMNAMTGPDYTLYPFSSMNEIDFRNLQRIYLDAVFRAEQKYAGSGVYKVFTTGFLHMEDSVYYNRHNRKPNLEYLDFLQEGWRLEHSNLKDNNSDLIIKGVVYNEMKGAFSENSSIFGQNLLNNLLPDHTYGYVSGGNPLEIPKLTHDDLVAFHKKYYHPSNSRIYCYGNFNLDKTLNYINTEYLSKYEAIDNSYSRIPNQRRWHKPRNVHISSRLDNLGAPFEKQNQISIALLMSDVTDINETFVLYVLSELLVKGPNSPFYKSLIEPNFSGGYNQTTGYDPQIKDTYFCVGLQDLKVEDFGRVQEIFDDTIKNIVQNGFERDHIESILHNIELSLKHQSPQFGLGLLFNSTPLWNHEGDIVETLRVSKLMQTFRENLQQDPQYLQKKVEHYFTNNTHRLTLTMSPDDLYESNFKQAEMALLKYKSTNLTAEDRKTIYENGLRLEESQKAPPNLEVLPCLDLADVKTPPKLYPINVIKVQDVPTQICNVQTNEISYLKCFFDSANLSREEVTLIPLFCNVIDDMGTQKYDFRVFDKIVTSKTSGIDFKLHFAENIYDSKTYDLGVLMTTHALDYNSKSMFDLVHEVLCNFKMDDVDRLNMLIENYMSSISVGITSSGHLYAMQSCNGLVTDSAKLKSELAGLEHIELMKKLLKDYTPEEIQIKLVTLGKKLFNAQTMRVAINTSEENLPKLLKDYEGFLKKLPRNSSVKTENKVNLLAPACQHFVMNIPVNYCAKAFFTVPYIHRDHPALRILAKLISAKYLLPLVREQNGAYGAGAKLGSDGIFSFYSYRDPNSTKTFDAFDNTYKWLKESEKEITEQTLFEAKLGVLQQLDSPTAPGNLGVDFFLYGVSQELFQKYRQRMLNVTLAELNGVVEKYFKDKPHHYGKCILGPENKDLVNTEGDQWKTIV